MPNESPTEIDKIAYDAPLSFPEPSQAWKSKMGERENNRTEKLVYGKDVPIVDLKNKWIIISGANSGIGREAALTFASWGAHLILACREPGPASREPHPVEVVEECKAAAREGGHESTTIEWWRIDMADLGSIEAFGRRWLTTERPLDVLCNNAGVGSSPGKDGKEGVYLTKDGFEFIHQINFLSHVLLTSMLLPSLAKAEAPRIVCTTSCFHYLGQYDISNFNGGTELGQEGVGMYKNNKLYFQIWLTELQRRLLLHGEYKHITVNGFHPGYVASGIWNINRAFWFRWLIVWILMLMARFFGINCQQGSMALVYIATAPECGPDPKKQGGKDERGRGGGRYFNRIWQEEAMPHCRDADARCRVWRKVAEELKLKERGLLDVLGFYGGTSD
ncbi:hypothetical protein LTR05_001627 [Lithohypha guttulata]|uniref:NAD(P)-binding protein n=1 Tax=Lithohypha guttulata TaxID=1690604 RepID=A0AAN7T7W2_9EURO|nr:hypothetical protein LTR05_001627 [Lithohypha guttulata]